MDWKLYDDKGNFLCNVNCQYDACDVARWNHQATSLQIDFETKTAYIVEKETQETEATE